MSAHMSEEPKTLILSVDDNIANRYLRSRVLRDAGFEIIEAGTGRDALRLLAERDPDLLLLDVRLPDMSGIEVCRQLRATENTRRKPVIQISATHLTRHDEEAALSAGADIYLFEPVGAQELASAVRTLLKLHAAEREREALLERAREAQRLAEEAVRMKDEFLAMLSHELRTPMSAVLGWLHLIKTGQLTPEQQRNAVDTIERNARVQTQLVNDLLDISRIVTGKMEMETEVMALDRAIENAIGAARLAGGSRDVRIAAHIPRGAWNIIGNPGRVQQIFSNLIGNAIKFSPNGSEVSVRVERDGQNARVTVADQGEGISAELLPHVFDRFRQADSSSRRRHGGLGLGLAIVRSLVELHGGLVRAESPGPGKGATFTVSLPLAPEGAVGAAPQPHKAQGDIDLSGIRVLVVDDDASNLHMVGQMLNLHGASAMISPGAAEALAIVRGWTPDVLVLDIGMPGMDGYDLLAELRTSLGSPDLPAVALTGYASAEDAKKAYDAGFSVHVAKPFDMLDLCDIVARLSPARPRNAGPSG